MQHTTKSRQHCSSRAISYSALVSLAILIFLLTLTIRSQAQWDIEDSHTTASLRGIDSVGNGIAWASGTNGTILRTEDGGYVWQLCAIPPGAEKLDFRGIQAFDANTAIVMSSGKGDLSRLYKTTDGCQTWKLIFTNPDKDGFWDAVQLSPASGLFSGPLVGDPVDGKFPIWWIVPDYKAPANSKEEVKARTGEAAFAASNSAMFAYSELFWLGTGGAAGSRVIRKKIYGGDGIGWINYPSSDAPVGSHTESSGIFSLAFAIDDIRLPSPKRGVAVGGDYRKPDDTSSIAAFTTNSGRTWKAARTQPHGYRSAVAYDAQQKLWITVGPNGTDISRDDGRNWTPLKPTKEDAPDADKNWNALSLPFVVGPNGRIGKLRSTALNP